MIIPNKAYRLFLREVIKITDKFAITKSIDAKSRLSYWEQADASKGNLVTIERVGTQEKRHFYHREMKLAKSNDGEIEENDSVIITVLQQIGYEIPNFVQLISSPLKKVQDDHRAKVLFQVFLSKEDQALLKEFPKLRVFGKPNHFSENIDNSRFDERGANEKFFEPNFLNLVPNLHNQVIGREIELVSLENLISKANKIVLLNGLGGIGKTTLAKKFLHANKHQYRNIAWVSLTRSDSTDSQESIENFASAFANDSILVKKGLNLEFKSETPDFEKFDFIIFALQNLRGPNLLVIDNAEQSVNYFKEKLPIPPNWHVLITSRTNLIGYEVFSVSSLSNEAAFVLFRSLYDAEVDDIDVHCLLEEVGFHTLTIELLAKTLKSSIGFLNIKQLIEKLQTKNLNDTILYDLISTSHTNQDATLLNHLLITFRLTTLDESEIYVLKCFYFLPPDYYEHETLIGLFEDIGDVKFIAALKSLYRKGWLQFDGAKFQMHRLIQMVIYYALSPNVTIIEPYIKKLSGITWAAVGQNQEEIKHLLPFALFLISQISENDAETLPLGSLCLSVATIHRSLGEFSKAEIFIDNAITVFLKLSSTNAEVAKFGLAMCYSLKSRTAADKLQRNKSEDYLSKSIKFWTELKALPESKYTVGYYNDLVYLADFYFSDNKFELAEKYYFESLELRKSLYKDDPDRFAFDLMRGYQVLSNLFVRRSKWDLAKNFADQAEILGRTYGYDNVNVRECLADVLCLSALISYNTTGKLDTAILLFDESIGIYEKLSSPFFKFNFAITLTQYGDMLLDSKQFALSEIQFRKAESIYSELFEDDRVSHIYDYALVLSQLGFLLEVQELDGIEYLLKAEGYLKELIEVGGDYSDLFYHNNDVIGLHFYQKEDYSSAVRYMEVSKLFYQSHLNEKDFKFKLADVLKNLGFAYDSLADYPSSIDNFEDYYNHLYELHDGGLIDGYILVNSAMYLTQIYAKANDQESKLEMIRNSLIILQKYSGINLGTVEYQMFYNELAYLYGPNFEEWYEREVVPFTR